MAWGAGGGARRGFGALVAAMVTMGLAFAWWVAMVWVGERLPQVADDPPRHRLALTLVRLRETVSIGLVTLALALLTIAMHRSRARLGTRGPGR